ncbi:MAG: carboxy terminal-processing peptidase [Silvanigrellales bacterium]|nr:carboxy terminal-processing peptidase [Silvanigrellales bacterium]
MPAHFPLPSTLAFLLGASFLCVIPGFAEAQQNAPEAVQSATQTRKLVLSCAESRARMGQFLDLHYVFRTFDNEISRRTFKKLFEGFDPGKNYFLASDLASFKAYEEKVDDLVARADCRFLDEVAAVYRKRVDERNTYAFSLLAKPFAFTAAEEMPVGKSDWAASDSELNERWRKRLKFQILNLKDAADGGEAKARERLKKRYEQSRKAFAEQTSDDVYNTLINAFALALDPHSTHFLPADQEDFNIRLGNQLEGIGATLQEIDGYITVQAIVPGGAAARDGRLKASDKIIAVDSGDGSGPTDVIDMDLSKAVRLIRGKKGTLVKLVVLRKSETGNERISLNIIRDAVKLTASEAKGEAIDVSGKRIGVIRLPNFYTDFACRMRPGSDCNGASYHVLRELKKLQANPKLDGVILDLRNNGGGDLQESIRLSGLFIPEGTVVQTVDRRRITRTQQDQDPSVQYAGPLVVMINKYSASASEIVAGALQDYGRAVIVGDGHSYGKATVQVVQDIPGTDGRKSDGAIKVTQSKFYRPSGRTNQEKGVASDIQVPSLLEVYDVGEKENDFVLRADTIKPAPDFRPLQSIASLIPTLTKQSAERVAKSKEFAELREQMEKSKKEKDKATVSLKEDSKKDVDKKKEREQEEKEAREAANENVVVRKSDIQLQEAAQILVDAIELTKSKANWTSSASR